MPRKTLTLHAAAQRVVEIATPVILSLPEPLSLAIIDLGKALARTRKQQVKGGRKATGRPVSVDKEAIRRALTKHKGHVPSVVALGLASEGTVRAVKREMG